MEKYWKQLGHMAPLMTEGGCIHAVGGGVSPVQEYDRYVIEEAEISLFCNETSAAFFLYRSAYAGEIQTVLEGEKNEGRIEGRGESGRRTRKRKIGIKHRVKKKGRQKT